MATVNGRDYWGSGYSKYRFNDAKEGLPWSAKQGLRWATGRAIKEAAERLMAVSSKSVTVNVRIPLAKRIERVRERYLIPVGMTPELREEEG